MALGRVSAVSRAPDRRGAPARPSIAIGGRHGVENIAAPDVDRDCVASSAYDYRFGIQAERDLPSTAALTALADAMMAPGRPESPDSTIPAGYTYLGQFVFHDITWIKIDPKGSPRNQASGAFDLDSVLGRGSRPAPAAGACPFDGPLRVGMTTNGRGNAAIAYPLPEDIPRVPFAGPHSPGDARLPGYPLLPDPRNDDFLPLSQTHLAFIKFHNAIARRYDFGARRRSRAAIDRCFILHAQAIVLHDYLARLIDPAIHADVLRSGRKVIHPGPIAPGGFRVPIEFAAAAARFGHSMIREQYRWNHLHTQAGMELFMDFSHLNGRPNAAGVRMRQIPREWIIDWTGFYDLRADCASAGPPAMAKQIDTRLAAPLGRLPERLRVPREDWSAPPDLDEEFSLARATLLRQRDFKMASAQIAIQRMNADLGDHSIMPLTSAQLVQAEPPPVVEAFRDFPELSAATPIWFYVLKEARLLGGGDRLGHLGSRLVMETVHAAIDAGRVSILRDPTWRPSLPRRHRHRFTMADLLAVCGNPNPLGAGAEDED